MMPPPLSAPTRSSGGTGSVAAGGAGSARADTDTRRARATTRARVGEITGKASVGRPVRPVSGAPTRGGASWHTW